MCNTHSKPKSKPQLMSFDQQIATTAHAGGQQRKAGGMGSVEQTWFDQLKNEIYFHFVEMRRKTFNFSLCTKMSPTGNGKKFLFSVKQTKPNQTRCSHSHTQHTVTEAHSTHTQTPRYDGYNPIINIVQVVFGVAALLLSAGHDLTGLRLRQMFTLDSQVVVVVITWIDVVCI